MLKWKQGTGGGSGAPENYSDWNQRDDCDFRKYGGHKGDVLAWVYMMDKKNGFPLLEMYDDTPSSIVIEDSNTQGIVTNSSPAKRKRTGPADAMKEVGQSLTSAMTEGFGHMTRAMEMIAKSATATPNHEATYAQGTSNMMQEINNGFATITAIEEHIEKLRVRQNDQAATASRRQVLNDYYEHQIEVLTKSLKAVYEKIEEVVNKSSGENNSI